MPRRTEAVLSDNLDKALVRFGVGEDGQDQTTAEAIEPVPHKRHTGAEHDDETKLTRQELQRDSLNNATQRFRKGGVSIRVNESHRNGEAGQDGAQQEQSGPSLNVHTWAQPDAPTTWNRHVPP